MGAVTTGFICAKLETVTAEAIATRPVRSATVTIFDQTIDALSLRVGIFVWPLALRAGSLDTIE